MNRMGYLIIVPRWFTFLLFASIIMQVIVSWLHAKKTGKSFRAAVLPNALIAAGVTIILVREFFAEVPPWIDGPLAILCFLLILFAFGLWAIQLKRYLQESWRLEEKKDK
jgi:hypothetical protein